MDAGDRDNRERQLERLRARWAVVTPKNRTMLSPDMQAVAPLFAMCRALVREENLPAANDFLDIVDGIGQTDVGEEILRLKGIRYSSKQRFSFEILMMRLKLRYADLAYPRLQSFADEWLFGSPGAVVVLGVMSVADLIDLDIMAIENARVLRETWKTFHGHHSKARDEMRKVAREHDFKNVGDARLMREAAMWVRAHHVYKSLAKALDAEDPDGWNPSTYRRWSIKLGSYDRPLGNTDAKGKRKPGPWT